VANIPGRGYRFIAAETYDMAFTDINLLIKFRDQNPQFRINTVFMTYNNDIVNALMVQLPERRFDRP
jgi:hypothetical protein